MENKTYVEGVLFKEIDTKFGKAITISFSEEFLQFLMSRVNQREKLQTIWFRKKKETNHTTHYGLVQEKTKYITNVEEKYSQQSKDHTASIDPNKDIEFNPF